MTILKESCENNKHQRLVGRLFQQPALMFAVKGFEQASAFWFSPGAVLLDDVHSRGQDRKTTVEQALMRGLVTA
jgi:hypothetical protein